MDMIDEIRSRTDHLTLTSWRRWARESRTLPDDEVSIDLPVDTSVFRLLDLPVEMITMIFENLVPAPLPTGTELPLSTEILASRRALVDLCHTSKLCREIAFPLVYNNIIITSRVQMAQLLADLLDHQDRCTWIRNLALLEDWTSHEISEKDDRAALTRSRRSLETCDIRNPSGILARAVKRAKSYIYQLYVDTGSSTYDHRWYIRMFYQHLVQIILYLGTRIEDLFLSVPPLATYADLLDYRALARGNLDETDSARRQPVSSDQAFFGDTFKALRRVRTQADPTTSLGFEPLHLTLAFNSCKRWELFDDNGKWWSLLPYGYTRYGSVIDQPFRYLEMFSHVTELRLYASRTHPAWLRQCLRRAKNLERLSYTTNATEWNHDFAKCALPPWEVDATLQQAVDEVRDILTELHLGWAPWGAYLTEEDEAAVAPHRVDVRGFPRLKRIEVEEPFVYHEDQDEGNDSGGDFDKE